MKSLLISIAVLALALGIGFAVMAVQSRAGKAPGLVDGQLKPCGDKPNCVSSMARASDSHHVDGIRFEPGNADTVWAELTNAIVELGGELRHNGRRILPRRLHPTCSVLSMMSNVSSVMNRARSTFVPRHGLVTATLT